MGNIIVIGGGPAGIMAALTAAENGAHVTLWERNRSIGRKLSITGKGRCNLTNRAEIPELVKNIPGNGSFLYSSFSRFDAADALNFFAALGLETKVERGRRVFPVSDDAKEVVAVLDHALRERGVELLCNQRAKSLAIRDGRICGVCDYPGRLYEADAVIVATGGVTYPATGSTGDGYGFAKAAGHSIVEPKPSLVPLETVEEWPTRISGLSLKNVELRILKEGKLLDKAFGEMLFTHFGISGPIVLSLSNSVTKEEQNGAGLTALLDLKPALSQEQLDQRLQRNFQKFSRKQFSNSLGELLPNSMIPEFITLTGIPADKPVNQLTRAERGDILLMMKELPMTIKKPRPIDEAIVTAGGVSVREIDPKTMASKLLPGLFFAGEVMDVDGYTGGYNLQVAWSSGYTAGQAAAWSI